MSIPWKKIAGEAILIVASVFVAITLDSLWQEHRDAQEARAALGQLLEELRQDRGELDAVTAEQRDIGRLYADLRRWLGQPATLPADEISDALSKLAWSNRTIFAHRASWTTIVEGGQLRALDDPALVATLADLYENVIARLAWNSELYDRELFETMREHVPTVWSIENRKLSTDDPRHIEILRDQLRYMHEAWNKSYLGLLEAYQGDLDRAIAEVDRYLQER